MNISMFFYAPCLAVKVNVITARARENKRTARLFVSARKDHSIPQR